MYVSELLRGVKVSQDAFERAKGLYRDRLAPDFNPFDFIEPDEMRLSSILAWLLNPEATHGQGGRFLQLFLNRLAAGWRPDACDRVKVKTESWVEEGRLDVIVSSGNRVFVIENKPWAANQPEQLKRYLTHLDRLMRDDTTLKPADFPLIYLTADGSAPPDSSICAAERLERTEAGQLHCWSYREHILEWVTQCRAACRADRVSTFIDEFARYIGKTFAGVADVKMQDQLVEEIVNSAAMVTPAMQVVLAGNAIRDKLLSKLHGEIAAAVSSEGWIMDWKVSSYSCSGLNIDFSPQLACFFRLEFYRPNFNDFCYGAFKKDKSRPDDGGTRTALLSVGPGKGDAKEYWPWWRHSSLHDDLFPFEPNWGSSPQPWAAIADRRMASAVIGTALRLRNAMLGPQDGGMRSGGDDQADRG